MRFPAILKEAAAVFGRVSVVQIASEVSAKERAEGRRNIARKNREVQRAGFLQAASSGGEAETTRQGCFGESLLHQRSVLTSGATHPEGTSDPAQRQRGRIAHS